MQDKIQIHIHAAIVLLVLWCLLFGILIIRTDAKNILTGSKKEQTIAP